ncbi:MAG: hypothetical protein KF865_01270 [Bdellovibrionaceae bacterium]|nr:hypothetical protein [Pseudobdellovibrionaceae bacterium]
MNKITLSILSLLAAVVLLSCGGTKDADQIGDAQFCLDKLDAGATAADVNACLEKIEGMTSPGAEGLRCAGAFIREGFSSGKRFNDAFKAIDNGASGSSLATLMGIVTFSSMGNLPADFSNVGSAFDSCMKSGSKGATMIVSFSYLTMAMISYFDNNAPITTCTGNPCYDLETQTTDVANTQKLIDLVDPSTGNADAIAAQTSIGAIIIASYNLSCTGSSANKDLCDVFQKAIDDAGGTGNPRRVTTGFLTTSFGY